MEKFGGFCPVTGWVPYGARVLLVGTTTAIVVVVRSKYFW